jgi:hypothetical protein
MKVNKVTEIATLLANNPTAKVEDVLKKFKVSKTYAYNLMTKARKKIANSPAGQAKAEAEAFSQLVYMATSGKKHRMQGASERIAETHHTYMVNHPPHYTAGGVECIDALTAATVGLEGIEAVCTANAIKYLWRWKRKNGVEDLRKARWYIDRLISLSAVPQSPK